MITSHRTNLQRLAALTLTVACAAFSSTPAFAGWWTGEPVAGSGNIVKQERSLSSFKSIDADLPAKIELRQGDVEAATVETDDNLQSLVETVVERGTLKIRSSKRNTYPDTKTLRIVVFLKTLEEIDLGGSGSVTSTKLNVPSLEISIGGATDMDLQHLQANDLKVSIGGSGKFIASGTAAKVSGRIGGSGRLLFDKLESRDVAISIGGSGTVQTWVKEHLSVSIGGSGTVSYYGDPTVSQSIGGSGTVRRLGAAPAPAP